LEVPEPAAASSPTGIQIEKRHENRLASNPRLSEVRESWVLEWFTNFGKWERVVDWSRKAGALICVAGMLVMSATVLSGCSSQIADMRSLEPVDAPAPPKQAGSYLPVNDLPQGRDEATMSPEERAKVEKELIAARDRQASATAKDAAAK
jgi:hypothetical protein